MFDRRSNAKGPTLRCSGEGPILSCASKGTVLAVADGSEIWFFDCRNGRPLRKFDESHSDEISVLRFRDGADPILLSGGTDGLVCIFDCNVADESDALLDVLNEDTSVSRIGFLDEQRLWLTTDMGGLSVWNRENAVKLWGNPQLAKAVNAQWTLGCLRGMEGRVACAHEEGTISIVQCSTMTVEALLQGGHTAIPRACVEVPGGLLATGAEDGRLIIWGGGALAQQHQQQQMQQQDDNGPIRRPHQRVAFESFK